MKQFFLLSIFVFVNTLFGQTNNSFFSGKRNLSFNINYDENGFFSEGYYHFNTTSNYFVEASINDFNLDKNRTSFFSTTIGSMRSISLNTTFGFGYTSYFDNELEYEHELFLGSRYNFFSGIIYFDAQQNLLSSQAIINANLIFKRLPFELDFSIINNNSAHELFLNLYKTFNNDLFIGYILSREEYEGSNKFSYSKNGKTGTYIIETTDISFFNEIYVGFYF
ncbi:MAG: hypothetical protein HOI03_01765 [Candidatus Marinimicrobia bacterium]|nr:hypothetical protein [Candidatus Neomarinimicrobiota bacterium]